MCVEYLVNINLTSKNITLSTLKEISCISTNFFYYSANVNNFCSKRCIQILNLYLLLNKKYSHLQKTGANKPVRKT